MTEVVLRPEVRPSTPPQPRPDVLHMQGEQLSPKIRKYAGNLQRQILDSFATANAHNIEEYIAASRSGRVTEEETKRVLGLMRSLSTAVDLNDIPFNMNEFYEEVEKIVMDWQHFRESNTVNLGMNAVIPAMEKDDIKFFEEREEELPWISNEALRNPQLYDNLIHSFSNLFTLTGDTTAALPMCMSFILNRSVKYAPEDLQKNFRQTVDLQDKPEGIRYLGFRWGYGTLDVTGALDEPPENVGMQMNGGQINIRKAGEHAGIQMNGGRLIISESAENNVGEEMKGGLIRVKAAKDVVGNMMNGGSIEAENLGKTIGSNMKGGSIYAEFAQGDIGFNMEKGEIHIEGAISEIGRMMKGGSIRVDKANNDVGTGMEGGRIDIGEMAEKAGFHMKGGELHIGKIKTNAGFQMKGGSLLIDEIETNVGQEMETGSIYAKKVTGDNSDVGTDMKGGTIVVEEAQDNIGQNMEGGEIRIEKVMKHFFGELGKGMKDGKITVTKAQTIGREMQGGVIIAKEAEIVGPYMQGGHIVVEKATYIGHGMTGGLIEAGYGGHSLGKDMEGGTIKTKTAGEHLGLGMKGGTVEYESAKSVRQENKYSKGTVICTAPSQTHESRLDALKKRLRKF